eukprot:13881006-Heterocapsa_arctica.AAC.1
MVNRNRRRRSRDADYIRDEPANTACSNHSLLVFLNPCDHRVVTSQRVKIPQPRRAGGRSHWCLGSRVLPCQGGCQGFKLDMAHGRRRVL